MKELIKSIISKIVQSDYYDIVKIELEVTKSAADQLIPLLENLKTLGDVGGSREIIVSPNDNPQTFFFDGDGASKITKITLE